MKINLSQYNGFCEGVQRAYKMICDLDVASVKKPVCILGSLVHNPEVNRKVARKGIRGITREEFFNARKGDLGTIVVTAHGTGPDIFSAAQKKDIAVFDTTCPKVIKVQQLAKLYAQKGCAIVLAGDRQHKEIRGINDWANGKVHIVSEKKDWRKLNLAGEKEITVLSQTTQNKDFFKQTAQFLLKKFPQNFIKIIDTTCNATSQRQREVKKLADDNDAVLIIGSKTSANSSRLWEISLTRNPRSYFIENVREIDKNWLKGIKKIAVTSGASTPDWVIKKILAYLKNYPSLK